MRVSMNYSMGACRLVLASFMLFPGSASAWSAGLNSCDIFQQDIKLGSRTSFPAGPVELPRDDSGYARGYQAKSSLTDVGDINVTVFDCNDTATAYGLMSTLRQRLLKDAYASHFSCDGTQCGPAAGWVKLLSLKARPDEQAFGYTLASQRGDQGQEIVAIYSADLDKRPRVIVYNLRAFYSSVAKQAYDQTQVRELLAANKQPRAVITFYPGESHVSVPEDVLHALQIKAADGQHWVVVGYADRVGQAANSAELSWRRASAVARVMTKAGGIAANQLSVYALGEPLPTGSVTGKFDSRRVDIFLLEPEAAPAEPPETGNTREKQAAPRESTDTAAG